MLLLRHKFPVVSAQVPSSWCERLTEQVAAASGKHEKPWETVFDITGVRAGSLRLPFNDKVMGLSGQLEGRPLLPVVSYVFTFDEARAPPDLTSNPEATVGQDVEWVKMAVAYCRSDCKDEEWIRMGTVRRAADEPLTPWLSPVPRQDWQKRIKRSGGSGVRVRARVRRPLSAPESACARGAQRNEWISFGGGLGLGPGLGQRQTHGPTPLSTHRA